MLRAWEWAPRERVVHARCAVASQFQCGSAINHLVFPFLIYDPLELCHRENISRVLETSARPLLANFQTIVENNALRPPTTGPVHHIDIIFLSPSVRLSPSLIFHCPQGRCDTTSRLAFLRSHSFDAMVLQRYSRFVDGTIPVAALLYDDEENYASQDGVGIYDG